MSDEDPQPEAFVAGIEHGQERINWRLEFLKLRARNELLTAEAKAARAIRDHVPESVAKDYDAARKLTGEL